VGTAVDSTVVKKKSRRRTHFETRVIKRNEPIFRHRFFVSFIANTLHCYNAQGWIMIIIRHGVVNFAIPYVFSDWAKKKVHGRKRRQNGAVAYLSVRKRDE
jgi:cytochrome c oxidase assembly factor CtaG